MEARSSRRPASREIEHPLLELQRSAGNRAIASLVADPSRSPALLRALLQRDGPTGPGGQGGVQDVPIGQPAPAQVSQAELAAGTPNVPNTVTYTGAGAGPSAASAGTPAPAPQAPATTGVVPASTPAPATTPTTAPATTTGTAPAADTSTPHADPTLTVDPFNVTVTYTIADLHAWRSSHRLIDVDFIADPSVSISVGTDPAHAVAGQAAVNVILAHVKQNGQAVLDLGFGPSISTDGSSVTPGAQATAELHLDDHASLTFTAAVAPTPNATGGVDLNPSAVLGAAIHF
ncbi:MAG TPA: hypothetical protein VGM80_04660 [Gaiellaceae bacterium]